MQRIQDGRRNILIHEGATPDDLPLEGVPELPAVTEPEGFVPVNMKNPKLYPGDVLVGVYDGNIRFAELIFDKTDDGVIVVSLDTGNHNIIADQQFSSRFFNADEIHLYDSVVDEELDWGATFDESKLKRPEPARTR